MFDPSLSLSESENTIVSTTTDSLLESTTEQSVKSEIKELTEDDIRVDEKFRTLLPPLSKAEKESLEASLLKDGCLTSIFVLVDGRIVDGHNRWDICKKHNIPIIWEVVDVGANDDEIANWILEYQLSRRNLNAYQRIVTAFKCKDLLAAKARENQQGGVRLTSDKGSIDVNQKIAQIAGVGRDTVSKVNFIEEHGDEETKKSLQKGEKSINEVYKKLKANADANKDEKSGKAKNFKGLDWHIKRLIKYLDGNKDVGLTSQCLRVLCECCKLLDDEQRHEFDAEFRGFLRNDGDDGDTSTESTTDAEDIAATTE